MKHETRIITVKTSSAPIDIPALVYGELAIHTDIDIKYSEKQRGPIWTLTHISSGLYLIGHLTKRQAISLALRLSALDFSVVDSADIEANKSSPVWDNLSKRAREIIRGELFP